MPLLVLDNWTIKKALSKAEKLAEQLAEQQAKQQTEQQSENVDASLASSVTTTVDPWGCEVADQLSSPSEVSTLASVTEQPTTSEEIEPTIIEVEFWVCNKSPEFAKMKTWRTNTSSMGKGTTGVYGENFKHLIEVPKSDITKVTQPGCSGWKFKIKVGREMYEFVLSLAVRKRHVKYGTQQVSDIAKLLD